MRSFQGWALLMVAACALKRVRRRRFRHCGEHSYGHGAAFIPERPTPPPTPTPPAPSPPPGATEPLTLQLSASTYSAAQSAGSVTISVVRSSGSSSAASVNYATSNGTAVSGTDYTARQRETVLE